VTAPPFKGDHFARRAVERKGVLLTEDDRREILRVIRDKESAFVAREHRAKGPREIHELYFKNRFWRVVVAVYKSGNMDLVTCLPV
jgi:hypothetical protein